MDVAAGDIQVKVITLYPGRAAEEVEKQVTIPLEVVLSGLPHSVRMFSHTQFGLSFIMLTFDDQVNDYFARQQVLERLQTADLPAGVQPQLAALSTPIGEIYRYRLKGDHVNSRELRTLEDWVVERQLRMVPGIADIVGIGGLIKQYEVNPDMGKMKFYNLTLQQLFTALGRGNSNVGGDYVDVTQQLNAIQTAKNPATQKPADTAGAPAHPPAGALGAVPGWLWAVLGGLGLGWFWYKRPTRAR